MASKRWETPKQSSGILLQEAPIDVAINQIYCIQTRKLGRIGMILVTG